VRVPVETMKVFGITFFLAWPEFLPEAAGLWVTLALFTGLAFSSIFVLHERRRLVWLKQK
jgi:hypothetical protein